jgi:hypothetical protein
MASEFPRLYAWTVFNRPGDPKDPPDLGAVGVVDEEHRALRALTAALRDSPPEARGFVHIVTVCTVTSGYRYGRLIADGHLDPATGAAVWDDASDDPARLLETGTVR